MTQYLEKETYFDKHYNKENVCIDDSNRFHLSKHLCLFPFRIYRVICCLVCPRHCFKYQAVQSKCYFDMIFLFHKRIIILIGNLKQSKSSLRNSNEPEVLVIFRKGQGLGSQPEVKVNASFLTICKLRGNHSP